MKWLKIAGLIAVVLAVMRLGSWIPALLLARCTGLSLRWIAVAANAAAFLGFTIFLHTRLLPGEPADPEALLFGLAVYAMYALLDARRRNPWWARWRRPPAGSGEARPASG
jgi:hypothetical protein